MPPLIALTFAAVDAITVAAVAVGLPATAGPAIATTAATIALSVGASYALSLLTKPKIDGGQGQLTQRQGLPARFVVFGRLKLGGTLFFYDAAPSSNPIGLLCIGKILACHQINKIEAHWLLDYQVGISGPLSGSVTGAEAYGRSQWDSLITISTHLGAPGQTADATLVSLWSSSNVWTTSCKLQGIAYAVAMYVPVSVTATDFYSSYPNGPPEYRATIQGLLVWDPRVPSCKINDSTTWVYSDNAALIIAWYLMHPDGWGLGTSVIDPENIATQAAICDQVVATPNGATPQSEPRWRIWGKYSLDEQRKSVLADLLLACAGRLMPQPNGTIALYVGQAVTPTVTLTDDNIISLQNFVDGPEAVERVDIVKPRILYEQANWQDFDCPPWIPPVAGTAVAAGQTTNSLDLSLRFCPSPYQAQRVAKKIADEKNSGWRGTVKTTLAGLAAFNQWTIRLSISELDLANVLFEVLSVSLDPSTMTVMIGVREMSADVWNWDASQGTAVLAIPASVVSTFPQSPPTGVSALANGNHSITLSWTNGSGTATTQVQYRPAAASSNPNGWIEDDPPYGPATSLTTPILTGGSQYDLRVRDLSPASVASAWVAVYAITA